MAQQGAPLDDLARLPVDVLCHRIAHAQYAYAVALAQSLSYKPEKEKAKELTRLRHGNDLERVAAGLVDEWDRHR